MRARSKGEQDLRALIPGDDPITAEQRGVIERYLGSVASFAGDADEAVRHFQAGRDAVAAMLPDAPGLKRVYLALAGVAGGRAHAPG